jgi:hypothetical protein
MLLFFFKNFSKYIYFYNTKMSVFVSKLGIIRNSPLLSSHSLAVHLMQFEVRATTIVGCPVAFPKTNIKIPWITDDTVTSPWS